METCLPYEDTRIISVQEPMAFFSAHRPREKGETGGRGGVAIKPHTSTILVYLAYPVVPPAPPLSFLYTQAEKTAETIKIKKIQTKKLGNKMKV